MLGLTPAENEGSLIILTGEPIVSLIFKQKFLFVWFVNYFGQSALVLLIYVKYI